MAKIKDIKARIIVDSRANNTLEVDVILDDGSIGRASVPSGASAGTHEVFKLEDINQAKENVSSLKSILVGYEASEQEKIDLLMITQDGSANKSKLGGNVLLAISLAVCEASAKSQGKELFQYIHEICGIDKPMRIPTPMFNLINGGKNADNKLEFQDFLIIPANDNRPYWDKFTIGTTLYKNLRKILFNMGHTIAVGDEGGVAPRLNSNEEAIEVLMRTIEESAYKPGSDVSLGLDIAASSIADLAPVTFPDDAVTYFEKLVNKYPITALEDPLGEDDWNSWAKLTEAIGSKAYIVGDDLYTTNKQRLETGIQNRASNSIAIKPDQIGTLTETFQTMQLAHKAGMVTIISHRSGETESTFIADLAVGTGAEFIKTGAPSRSERVAKYNQLVRIAEKIQ